MGFRNSTFFPSYQPRVYMNDNRDDDDESSIAFSDDASCISVSQANKRTQSTFSKFKKELPGL